MIICTVCGYQVESSDGLDCCPSCKTQRLPKDTKDDVTIGINWFELQTLFIWAERWAEKCEDVDRLMLLRLAERVQKQYPNKPALTFSGQIGELREALQKEHPECTVETIGFKEAIDLKDKKPEVPRDE